MEAVVPSLYDNIIVYDKIFCVANRLVTNYLSKGGYFIARGAMLKGTIFIEAAV